MTELEKTLNKEEYSFKKKSPLKSVTIVDFMSQERKVPIGEKKTFRDVVDSPFEPIQFASKSHQIDAVYDSYLKSSINECKRVRRAKPMTPVEYPRLTAHTNIPVEKDQFWATNKIIKSCLRYYPEITRC